MATRKVLKKIIKNGQAYELPSSEDFVDLSSNQSIGGTKTFTTSPTVPSKSSAAGDNPTTIATEKQVKNVSDSLSTLDGQAVKTTGNQSIGGTKTFTTEPVIPTKSSLPVSPSATSPATEKQVEEVKNAIPSVDSSMSDSSTNPVQNKIVKAYIDDAIGGITGIEFDVVESLPATGTTGVIYLVPHGGSESQNIYDEYIWLTSSSSYEKIGTTAVDLSNYVDKTSNQTIGGTKTFSTSPVVPAKSSDASSSGTTVVATEAQVAKKLDSSDLGNGTISVKYGTQGQASVGSFSTNQDIAGNIIVPGTEFYTQAEYDNLGSGKATDNNSYGIYETITTD